MGVRGSFDNFKKNIIIFVILWVICAIFLVMPLTYGIIGGSAGGSFNVKEFSDGFMEFYPNFFKASAVVFANMNVYLDVLFKATIILIVGIIIIALVSNKHGYEGIEHGSGDWCGAEQYRILNKKSGILLAEKTYLPVDKRGNVNVLVVGRFWIW